MIPAGAPARAEVRPTSNEGWEYAPAVAAHVASSAIVIATSVRICILAPQGSAH